MSDDLRVQLRNLAHDARAFNQDEMNQPGGFLLEVAEAMEKAAFVIDGAELCHVPHPFEDWIRQQPEEIVRLYTEHAASIWAGAHKAGWDGALQWVRQPISNNNQTGGYSNEAADAQETSEATRKLRSS